MDIRQVYAKCQTHNFINSDIFIQNKDNTKYYFICSRFSIYLQDTWKNDILINIKFFIIGSLLINVFLDLLFELCKNKTKMEINNILQNINSINDELMIGICSIESISNEITNLKKKLTQWINEI